MDYDASLLMGADIVTHTGVHDLADLTTSGELDLDAFALAAHRAIFRRLEAAGVRPTELVNADRLVDAIAYEAVKRLALAGHLSGDPEVYRAEVDSLLRTFRPAYASGDAARNAAEGGIPVVGHHDGGATFSGRLPHEQAQYFSGGFPEGI